MCTKIDEDHARKIDSEIIEDHARKIDSEIIEDHARKFPWIISLEDYARKFDWQQNSIDPSSGYAHDFVRKAHQTQGAQYETPSVAGVQHREQAENKEPPFRRAAADGPCARVRTHEARASIPSELRVSARTPT